MDQLAPDQNFGLYRGRRRQCDFGYGVLLYPKVHKGRISAHPACSIRSLTPRQSTRHGLSLLPYRRGKILPLQRPCHTDLHELPYPDQVAKSKAGSDPRIMEKRQSCSLGSNPQGSRLCLLQSLHSRESRGQLRRLPRPGQPHGGCLSCKTPKHGMVLGVPSRSAKLSSSARPDYELGLETSIRYYPAGAGRKIRTRLECESTRQLQRLPSLIQS